MRRVSCLVPGFLTFALGSIISLLITLAPFRATGAIDFTPTTGERTLEGVIFKQLIFHEDGHRIIYEQPRGWTYSGDASRIRFTPPNVTQAQAEIRQSPLSEPQTLNDATTKVLRDQVLASVPKDSQQVVIIAEEKNPVVIDGHETYAVTAAYTAYGQEYQLGVMFMNLSHTQLQFRVTARKKDFEKVNRLFRGSLFSLQGI